VQSRSRAISDIAVHVDAHNRAYAALRCCGPRQVQSQPIWSSHISQAGTLGFGGLHFRLSSSCSQGSRERVWGPTSTIQIVMLDEHNLLSAVLSGARSQACWTSRIVLAYGASLRGALCNMRSGQSQSSIRSLTNVNSAVSADDIGCISPRSRYTNNSRPKFQCCYLLLHLCTIGVRTDQTSRAFSSRNRCVL
jgi:hypothetical protein